jgi:peptidyl-prolyl cis-trans isomerase SurA
MMTQRPQGGEWRVWAAALCLLLAARAVQAQSQAAKDSVEKTAPVAQAAAPKMPVAPGVPLDQVVAIVNGDLVLDSDVDEERRFEAFQPYGEAPAYSRDRAIERLINRDLILQQAKLGPEEPVTDQDVSKDILDLRKNIPACKEYHCETEAGWEKFLQANGFTVAEFNARWKRRMQVLQFIEERFRQGIRISDADVKAYYEKTLVPQFEKQGAAAPKLEAVSERIQEVLLEQQVSNLLGDWLKSLRAQGDVTVLHPGEAAP